MANFNSGKNIAVVIQLQQADKEKVLSRLKDNTSKIFGLATFAYILHDKDKLDTGEIKGNHIHLLMHAETAKSSNNWIAHFSDLLGVEKSAVSVEMLGSEKQMLRYLLHLDDPVKHQYDRSEVITNMQEACKKAWEASTGYVTSPTIEQLQEAIKQGYTGLYNLVGFREFERAKRVTEALNIENGKIAYAVQEVESLYNVLRGFTANPKYLKTGDIPMKDFQEALKACSKTLENLLDIDRYERNKKK